MSAGDIVNPKRVRMTANERVDAVDVDAVSSEIVEHADAATRSLQYTPVNAGGTAPTGLILTGFGLTLNPTGGSDGKVRVGSALGVAIDSDGRKLIKEAGIQVDVNIPAGTNQLYAYWIEGPVDTATRRFIGVVTPFPESPKSTATRLQSNVAFFTRAGNATSIVASDNVNGQTRALCCIGIVTNTAGVITISGYDGTTAPNGTTIINRLTTINQPSAVPATNAVGTTAMRTLYDMVVALGYTLGQMGWKGSRNTPPNASNNFQAYVVPPVRGLDALFDSLGESTVTPTTAWRDFNLNRRALIDHGGYRMGQVSEIDDHWRASTIIYPHSLSNAVRDQRSAAGGGWLGFGFAPPEENHLRIDATGQMFSSAYEVSQNTTIVSFEVFLTRSNATDVVTVRLCIADNTTGSMSTPVGLATSSSGTGSVSVVCSPSTGDFIAHAQPGTQFYFHIQSDPGITGIVRISQIRVTQITDPEGWQLTTNNILSGTIAGMSRAYTDPAVDFNQRAVTIKAPLNNFSSGVGAFTPVTYETFLGPDVAYVQEWMVKTGTITAASNVRVFALGVQFSNSGANDKFVYFFNQNTTANWQVRVVGSTTVDNDTGVAIAANTVYRMRLEINGSNVSTAGVNAFRIRGYINGTKVVDVISNTIVNDLIRPYFKAGTTAGSSGPFDFKIGRLRRAWNHLLAGDNL